MSSAWNRAFNILNTAIAVVIVANCILAAIALGRAESVSSFLYFHLGLTGLLFCPLLALVLLRKPFLDEPLPLRALGLSLLLCLLIALLASLSETRLVNEVLGIIHRRFQQPYWQAVGLALAALIFLPLIWRALLRGLEQRRYADLLVCGGFLAFLLLLFLPAGFDSIGHWETWNYRAWLEGQFSWNVSYELTTRFWVAVPHLLATIISPDSFVGFHVTHLLIIWGKLVLLYGILRKLKFSRSFAFLATMLFMVYPINAALLSLRSLPNQFSIMSLLAAGYLILDYRGNPTRLKLLGIWLALTFNVVTNETAYTLILVVPALWIRRRRVSWKAVNLSLIWYLFPTVKVAHLLLLSALDQPFYNSSFFEGGIGIDGGLVGSAAGRLLDVFWHTFVEAWGAALLAFNESDWLPQTLIALALIAAIGGYLWRQDDDRKLPDVSLARRTLLFGIVFVIPAVGVLIWLDQYSGDLWRMYFYVPIGAAIVLASAIALITSPAINDRPRGIIALIICLMLMLPATARLFAQRGQFVASARVKADFLYDVMQLIPAIEADTLILLTTDMTRKEFDESDVYELLYSYDVDNAMLYVLYGDGMPVQSAFCLTAAVCSTFGGEGTIFTAPLKLLPRTLVIEIGHNLSVQLVSDPDAYFGLGVDAPYDPESLYTPNAPPPRRAIAMLKAQ